MATIANLVVRIGANIDNFNRNMSRLQASLVTIGNKINDIGKTMTAGLTVPVVGLGTAAVVTGAKFEAQMSKVAAVTGAVGEDFEALRAQAMELGSTTQFSASQAAEGMEFLGRAGWKTHQILAAMPGMLNLAAAGALDLGTAADITSNIMTGFQIEAEKASHVADVLAYASANANTDVMGLGYAMKYLAPVASDMGWSIHETTAAVMALSDAGIQGEQAGAAFSTSIQRLTDQSGKAKETLDELGVSFFTTEGRMKPLPEIIRELEKALKDKTDQERSSILTTLFGAEAYKHWSTLLKRGSSDLEEMTMNLRESDGTADKMAKTMEDNLAGSFRALLSALEGLAIEFGEVLAPILRQIADIITAMTRRFSALSPGVKQAIVIIGALVAAIGPLIIIIGGVISFIGTLGAAAGALGVSMGGLIAIIGAVVGALLMIGSIVFNIVAGWDDLKAATIFVWDAISNAVRVIRETILSTAGPLIDWMVDKFHLAVQVITEIWSGLSQFFFGVWETIKNIFIGSLLLLVDLVTGDFEALEQDARGIWENLRNALGDIWEGIKTIFNAALKWLIGLVGGDFEAIRSRVDQVWSSVESIISDVWQFIKNTFRNTLSFIKALVSGDFEGMKTAIANQMNNIRTNLGSAWETIKYLFRSAGNLIRSIVRESFEAMKSVIINQMTASQEAIRSGWNKAVSFLKSINLRQIGRDVIQGFINGITSMASTLRSKVNDMANSVKNSFRSALRIASPSKVFKEYGEWTGEGFSIGLDSTISDIAKMAKLMVKAATPEVDTAPRMIGMSPFSPSLVSATTHVAEPQVVAPEYVVVRIGAHEIVRAIAPEMGREQYRLARERGRSMGRGRIR